MNLKNKTVLITGASSGIGKAISDALILKGAKVISFDIKPNTNSSEDITHFTVDITKYNQIEDAVNKIKGTLDIVINNAGIMRRGEILENTEEDFDALFAVNVKGAWLVLKALKQKLSPNAKIVQMCSRHAINLPTNPALYGLSKKMMMDMGEIISKTYPNYSVEILCPGPVNTELTRVDTTKEQMEEKKKIMEEPEKIAEKTIELLELDNKSHLIFDKNTAIHSLK